MSTIQGKRKKSHFGHIWAKSAHNHMLNSVEFESLKETYKTFLIVIELMRIINVLTGASVVNFILYGVYSLKKYSIHIALGGKKIKEKSCKNSLQVKHIH